jgi:hypothetical protein
MIHRRLAVLVAAVTALALTAPPVPPAAAQAARAYFSDTDDPGGAVVALVDRAQRRLEAAIYDLTDRRIAEALIAASQHHVDTWVVVVVRPGTPLGATLKFADMGNEDINGVRGALTVRITAGGSQHRA